MRTVLGVLALVLVIGSVAPGAALRGPTLNGLDSADAGERFEAAMKLTTRRDQHVIEMVREALTKDAFKQSEEARAAAEFVLWKQSGEALPVLRSPKGKAPNVLLISVDTLRPDHLGCYGYARDTTPAIDALAGRGVLFRRAYSTSNWTLPAHMSLLTSLYPSFHKLDKGGKLGGVRLDASETTLAQLLGKKGYATAGIVAHPFLAAEWGFDRGFGIYVRQNANARQQTDRAATWLEWNRFHASRGMSAEPFFLFLHYIDPHETYDPPHPYKKKYSYDYLGNLQSHDKLVTMFANADFPTPADFQFALDVYDNEISYVDAQLGRLFDKLDEMGLTSSTAIIFTSDHGEEFKDHGSMGHKRTLYEESVRVPLIISLPQRLQAGRVVEEPVSLVDVVPTVLRLIGAPPLREAQGVDLVPRMQKRGPGVEPRPIPDRDVYLEMGPIGYAWERNYYRRGLVRSDRKLLYNYLGTGDVTQELYRLDVDPKETRDVYSQTKDDPETRRFDSSLIEFVNRGKAYNPRFREKNDFEINDEILEKLRALGYVQ